MQCNDTSHRDWWLRHRDKFHGVLRDLDKARVARDVASKDSSIHQAACGVLGLIQDLSPPAGWMGAGGQPSCKLSA